MENTLVLFTTDHGEMLGDRGACQKHVPYEGSAHIPLIACGPGFAPGRCTTPVTTWDTAATIIEAAGIQVPEGHPLVGVSLRVAAGLEDDRVVVYNHGSGRRRYVAAVSGRWKYVHWYNGGNDELYDLEADPWEQVNLMPGPDGRANGKPLRQACVAFERTHGVAGNVAGEAFVDVPYESPPAHSCSLHPQWSYRQFPRWMNGYSQEDLARIAEEMVDSATSEYAFICREPEWRADAAKTWQGIGGDPEVYETLFRDVDGERGGK